MRHAPRARLHLSPDLRADRRAGPGGCLMTWPRAIILLALVACATLIAILAPAQRELAALALGAAVGAAVPAQRPRLRVPPKRTP